MTAETWRHLPDAPRYEVSDFGRVRRDGSPMKGYTTRRGYREVSINGKAQLIHRLVAKVFLGPIPPGQEVRHLNDQQDDNRLINLAFGTHSQNMDDRVRNGGDPQANQTSCKRGHPFDEQNTHRARKGDRYERRCKTCARETSRAWMRAHRAAQKADQ